MYIIMGNGQKLVIGHAASFYYARFCYSVLCLFYVNLSVSS